MDFSCFLFPLIFLFRPTCWLESFLSKEWFERLLNNGNKKLDSKVKLFSPFKSLLKLTWFLFLRTPTFVLFMPRELPSCQRIFNSPRESEETGSEWSSNHLSLIKSWTFSFFIKNMVLFFSYYFSYYYQEANVRNKKKY